MRRSTNRTTLVIAGTAVIIMWLGLAYDLSRPVEPRAYLRTLVQAAASAHDAAQTGRLIGEQELAGRITGAFAAVAFDDAEKALAGAQKKFAGEAPPDRRSTALRDQLGPLLGQAVTALGDTARSSGDRQLRDGVARLGDLAARLDDFITANQ
jgi:hypothetical protein